MRNLFIRSYLLTIFFIISLFTLQIQAASQAAFSDTGEHWSNETLMWAKEHGIASGYPDGSFHPNAEVTEAEFSAMLYRALNGEESSTNGAHWAEGYYELAAQMNYPLQGRDSKEARDEPISRTEAAEIIAWANGEGKYGDEAINYILEQGYSEGKTSATLEGYVGTDSLTRAESVQFIKNILDAGMSSLTPLPSSTESDYNSDEFTINGISVGDTVEKVLEQFGPPQRKDTSKYGFTWYVYNQLYSYFMMVGVQEDQVVALYTNANRWSAPHGLEPGSTSTDVSNVYGSPLTSIQKGNVIFTLSQDSEEVAVYEVEDQYVTFFYDIHDGSSVAAVQYIDKEVEQQLDSFYGQGSTELQQAYEAQIFDLANVERVKRGMTPFKEDDKATASARKHSEDMGERQFFDHINPDGLNPFDRMRNEGIDYIAAAENIAAGQTDAFTAHASWMNSKTGHRENILGETSYLGVGVIFNSNSPYKVYYTQNFFTPSEQ